jgi:hypothetical protein
MSRSLPVAAVFAIGSAVALLATAHLTARPSPDCSQSAAETVLEQFLSRTEEPLRQYRAWRRLYGRNEKFNREGWLEVWTERDDRARLRYEIIDEGGSDYVRNRVLKRVLESERASKVSDDDAAALTEANYRFKSLGVCGDGLQMLEVEPRRNDDVRLVAGTLFVTPREAELVRLEGQPAKNPSFWTRRIEIVRTYERLAGVRVLRQVQWDSHVRVAGPSSFLMVYEYETVNGRRIATVSEIQQQIEHHRSSAPRGE